MCFLYDRRIQNNTLLKNLDEGDKEDFTYKLKGKKLLFNCANFIPKIVYFPFHERASPLKKFVPTLVY